MISTGIITSPRQISYLGMSLHSYFGEDFPVPHVFAEPGTPHYLYESKTIRHDNYDTLGTFKNWQDALAYMYNHTETPWVLMCEDDVQWAYGSGEMLRDFLPHAEEFGFVSAYLSIVNRPKGSDDGWIMASRSWCGMLATCIHRSKIPLFLQAEKWDDNPHILDSPMGDVAYAHGGICAHSPSLVRHLGVVSSRIPIGDRFNDVDERQGYGFYPNPPYFNTSY